MGNRTSGVRELVGFRERAAMLQRECEQRGVHVPVPGKGLWVICDHCGAPLERPDGGPVALINGAPFVPCPN